MQALFVRPYVLAVLDNNISSEDEDSLNDESQETAGDNSSITEGESSRKTKKSINDASIYEKTNKELEELEQEANECAEVIEKDFEQ